MITVRELCSIAEMERDAIGGQFEAGGASEFSEQVWAKTLEEVSTGALIGPIALSDVGYRHAVEQAVWDTRSSQNKVH